MGAKPEITGACLRALAEMAPDAAWLVHYPRWVPLLRQHIEEQRTVIYDCMDWWSEFPDATWKISAWENELAASADFVLASAVPLYTRMKLLNPSTVYMANAVYEDDYASALPEAGDLHNIPRPRLLFVGSVEDWVDLDLVKFLAESRPEWSIVMVGPSSIPANRLPSLPNIYWLGKRPYEQLSAYMHHCDIGIIPFKQSRLTRGVNPLKVHEYVACGLPVVSTFLPDVLLFNDPAVMVAATYESFLKAVEELLRKRVRPRGAQGAHSGTWHDKAEQLLNLVRSRQVASDTSLADQYIQALADLHAVDDVPVVADELAEANYAFGNYEVASRLAPPNSALQLAALVRQQKYEEVRERLSSGAEVDALLRWPMVHSLDDHSLAAHVLQRFGDPSAALEELQFVAEYGPAQYVILGRLWASLGRYADALAVFSQVIEANAEWLDADDFLLIGDACVEAGFYANAEEFYLHAAELGRDDVVTERLADLYLMQAET